MTTVKHPFSDILKPKASARHSLDIKLLYCGHAGVDCWSLADSLWGCPTTHPKSSWIGENWSVQLEEQRQSQEEWRYACFEYWAVG
eukprot:CCRYP_020676-RB/>CCRYP_020676-RB protein AED:0.61 eAED:1.00 QI:0/0/0/0.5/0/0/2/0/85